MYVVRWALVLLLGTLAASACPDDCVCYQGDQANCTTNVVYPNRNIQNYPNIKELRLQPYKERWVTEPWSGMFSPFKNLERLWMNNCSVSSLKTNMFYGALNLQEIDLSFNKISKFPGNAFEDLKNLSFLSFRGNALQLNPDDSLVSASLYELDMGLCGLTDIPAGYFRTPELKRLKLDGNFFHSVDPDVPPSVTSLSFRNNRITHIPINQLMKNSLTNIDLSGNRIECTCDLIMGQDRLSNKPLIFTENIICYSPKIVRGKQLSKLREDQLCKKRFASSSSSQNELMNSVHYETSNRYNIPYYDDEQADQPIDDTEVFDSNLIKKTDTHMETKDFDSERLGETEGILPANKPNQVEESEGSGAGIESDTAFAEDTQSSKTDEDASKDSVETDNEASIETKDLPSASNSEEEQVTPSVASTTESTYDFSSLTVDNGTIVPTTVIFDDTNDPKEYEHYDSGITTTEKLTTIEEEATTIITTTQEVTTDAPIESSSPSVATVLEESSPSVISMIDDSSPSVTTMTEESSPSVTPAIDEGSPTVTPVIDDSSPTVTLVNVESSESSSTATILKAMGAPSRDQPSLSTGRNSEVPARTDVYVLGAVIVGLVLLLVLYAILKKKNAPSKVRLAKDVESNHGTELQDMDSLLPKPPENGVKIVNKDYGEPNGQLKEETMPVLQASEEEEKDEKDSPKKEVNGVEKATVRLTVLPDTMPRTPILIHKDTTT